MGLPRAALVVLLLALVSAGAATGRTEEEVKLLYEEWLVKHGKAYNGLGEKDRRFEIFKDNLRYIDEHNRPENNHSYELGLTRFADLTNDEFRAGYLGVKPGQKRPPRLARAPSDRYRVADAEELPEKVDWREMGAVAPVKDQGSCGSCWAFSTIATVEAINKIVSGDMITLSEQELVDCDNAFNQGCNGGLMDYAFDFIINNGGIDTEEDYPYKGRDGRCDPLRKNAKVVSIDSYEDVPVNDELALRKAVANQPVSVAIEAGGRNFQLYKAKYAALDAGEVKSRQLLGPYIGIGSCFSTELEGGDYFLTRDLCHGMAMACSTVHERFYVCCSQPNRIRLGVFDGLCGTELDHGVVAVGYGTDNGKDYWVVRNSWGEKWGEGGYIRMERNLGSSTSGKCGIAIEPSYPIKKGANPPNPGPSPPSPVKPPTVCDNYYSCQESATCCCIYEYGKLCFAWGCCPLEGAVCCDDHYSCCPHDYPVCNVKERTCLASKNNPFGVKMLRRSPAKPNWAFGAAEEGRSSM